MPDAGIGSAPLGSCPFGFGSPAKLNSTAALLFLDAQKVRRNAVQLNAVTGDVIRDASTGVHMGMDGVQQQVYLALRTLKGSAIVQNLGVSFKVKTISETTARKLEQEARAALSDLVLRQLVEIVKITSERVKMTAVSISVTWKNLTNGETNVTRWENG